MIVRYITYTLVWLLAMIVGLCGGYFLARYTGIGYSIWGNEVDGYCGDTNYKNNEAKAWWRKWCPCYVWSCIRNPANNLLRNTLCAEGVITSITCKGNLTTVLMEDGKRYFFYYKKNGYQLKFGWKLWQDQIQIGEYYKASFVFNP